MQTPRTPRPQLSGKQLRWIDEYLVDFNGAAAAVRAGYSPKTARSIACELLTKPDIRAVLQARQAAMAKELQITRQGVIRGLLDAVEMGREQQNSGAMVTALRELSKMLGFNAPEVKRVELTSDQQIIQNHMAALTDAQLLVLMQGHTALVWVRHVKLMKKGPPVALSFEAERVKAHFWALRAKSQ